MTTVKLTTTKGDIVIKLHDFMPITTANFVKLVKEGFYNGIIFHRVIPDFMVQAGCPDGNGTGGPGYTIKDEFVEGSTNKRGTISMANAGPNSGGSQFFINTVDNTFLDWNKPPEQSKHPAFGEVTQGMDIIDQISKVQKDHMDKPLQPITITKAEVIEE